MRVVFVATGLPVPATNGQRIRTLAMVRALAALGHEIAYVAPAPAAMPACLEPLRRCCRHLDLEPTRGMIVNLTERGDYARRLSCLARGCSYSIARFRSPAIAARIARCLRERQPDMIWCDSVFALDNVPPTAIPVVLNSHNVEHLMLRRYAGLDRNPLRRCYARLEGRALRRAERRACARAALVLACSAEDQTMLRRLRPDVPVFVAPNVVDTGALANIEPGAANPDQPVLLFQGAMDWFPNRDAAGYFAETVWPLVRAQCPGAKFVIAGRNPPAAWRQRVEAHPGVEFTGSVEDMRPYLAAATLVVVPLRLGSGTRIKILEACAAGKAVISTRVGAEGLELEDGRDFLLADDPADFARHSLALLRDAARRRSIALSGQRVVRERYSQAALEARLAETLAGIGMATGTLEAGAACR